MNNSVFYIIPAAHRIVANKLWELRGLGPNNYGVAYSPTVYGEKTHWGGNYENMPADEEAAVRALKTALPELDPGAAWGEGALPTEQEAAAAAAAMEFYIRDGQTMTAIEHQSAILTAKDLVIWRNQDDEA
ncbi:MAG TPA: hypothetical protein DCF73_00505 [Rhodobiaceae bacterium]|jgi:hypothetical protein|nr:hypothetical protein [Rhodobiaceae bacterium]